MPESCAIILLSDIFSVKKTSCNVRSCFLPWEVFRNNQLSLPISCDLIIIARKGYSSYSYKELEAQFKIAAKRASKLLLQP